MEHFSIQFRVYYEDTDAGGIVYHANYLRFTERARTDWLRSAGYRQQEMLAAGQGFVITKLKARFRQSARLDDTLRVTCVPIKVGRASIEFYQQVFNQDEALLFELECQIAFVDIRQKQTMAIPQQALEFAKSHLDEDDALGVDY